MFRLLVLLVLIVALAWSGQWLVAHPGSLAFNWLGYRIETSVVVGVIALVAIALVLALVWSLIRFVFTLPKAMSVAAHVRRRNRGYEALSRGLIAVGSGDARAARREAAEAGRLIRHDPMTLLLRAQAAQLSGDSATARALFQEMAGRADTKLLGLRGLYVEARRAGEQDAALAFAQEAQKISPVAWAGHALIERRAADGQWREALDALERSGVAGQVDKAELERGRAALKLALARDIAEREPETARAFAAEALTAQPDLAPAAALVSRLHARRGDYKKAARTVEQAWERAAHPDLAQAYIDVRPGDSSLDRLARARKLSRIRPNDPEGRLTLALVAAAAREFREAREALAPLVEGDARPTARVCAAMAQLEEAEGHEAKAREWWGRATRAPRDKAWIADGLVSETWEPVTPSGELGGYEWRTPDERFAPALELPDSIFEPVRPAPVPTLALKQPAAPVSAAIAAKADDAPKDIATPTPARPDAPRAEAPATPGASQPPAEPKAAAASVETAQANAGAPAVAKPESVKPESIKPEVAKPESIKPESVKPESAKPEVVKPESVKTDAAKPDAPKPAPGKPAPHPAKPEPVVFPLPKAPDDPGVRP